MASLKILSLAIVLFSLSCSSQKKETPQSVLVSTDVYKKAIDLSPYETAYFASGCFWCVEAIFESVKGVKEVYTGYAGGDEKEPTYKDVAYGKTSHAEAVQVFYNPSEITYADLLLVFFASQDPTTLNRQGPDRGSQYRSVAFYESELQRETIISYIEQLEETQIFDKPIVTEIKKFDNFWKAEDYHQDFEKRNPDHPYILNVSVPRLKRFQKKYPELLKKDDALMH